MSLNVSTAKWSLGSNYSFLPTALFWTGYINGQITRNMASPTSSHFMSCQKGATWDKKPLPLGIAQF